MRFRESFNKVVVVIGCLVLMAALVALFLFPRTVLTAAGDWLLSWGQFFQDGVIWPNLAIGAGLSLLVVFLLGLVIYWEVRSLRNRFIRVQQVAGGMAKVSTDSVKEMLEHRLDAMQGVINVDSHVRARGERVGIRVDADVVRGTNVPATANQIIKITQRVLTDDLGLQIDGPPEVSVTVVREEGEAEIPAAREEVEPAREPAIYPAAEPAATAAGGDYRHERRTERQRYAVIGEEEEEKTPPERQPERQERWLYEAEEPEPDERAAATGSRQVPVIPEQEETEDEERLGYHPADERFIDPFEQGKESRP